MKFIFPGWLYLKIIQYDAKVLLNPRSGSKSHTMLIKYEVIDDVWFMVNIWEPSGSTH